MEELEHRRPGIAAAGFSAWLAFALSALPASGQPAKTLYAAGTAPIYASAAARQAVGRLMPGTPLNAVEAARNGSQRFTIVAWAQDGDDRTLVAAQGRRIVLATLVAGARTKIISSVSDDYGNVWNEVELSGFVPASRLTSNQDTVWKQARALYGARCSACHALHKTTEFTANQWPTIVKTMAKNAALQPEQAALITQYVQTHSK
jgi:trimethylamine-N-oxide reductase cytochrome c-type subunit TorC